MPEPIREVWAVIQDDGQVVSMSHDRDSVVADLDFVEEHMDEPDRLWRGESVPGLTLTRLPIRTDAETAVIAAAETAAMFFSCARWAATELESSSFLARPRWLAMLVASSLPWVQPMKCRI